MSREPQRPGADPAPDGDSAGPAGEVPPTPAREGGAAGIVPPAGGEGAGDAARPVPAPGPLGQEGDAAPADAAQPALSPDGASLPPSEATRLAPAPEDGGQADADATRPAAPSQGTGTGVSAPPSDATRIAPPAGDATHVAAPDATRVAPPPRHEATQIGAAVPPRRRDDIARTQFGTPALQAQRQVQPVSPGVLINNNYRVQNLISAGGMGEVYRGENAFTGDPVAIKIVLPELARDPEIVSLFKREARILGQLTDDAIVRYHNFVLDTDLNRYCLVMEFIDGTHLWDYVDQHGPMAEAEALALMRRLATGLGKAHARGVTHRDLSPDNVILRGGRIEDAVLIDFGIARSDELGEGVLAGRFAGKLKYIAPEQLGHFGGRVGPQTDIYAMALMVAALLRGNPLEMGSSVVEAAQARRSIPDLAGLGPRAMPLLQYMLEPDPDSRPRDMAAVARMLDDPSHVPARYRLPLWREGAAGGRGERHTPTLDQVMSGRLRPIPVEDDSASPFGHVIPDRAAVAEPAPRRHGGLVAVVLGSVLAIGAGGWFWRDAWMPRPAPVQPVVAAATAPAAAADPWEAALAALPARDETTREGWLAARDLPACTLAERVEAGPDAGQIALFSPGPSEAQVGALADAYAARFSARPGVALRGVTPAQCGALRFVGALAGRAEAPPALAIDSDRLISGGGIVGRVGGSAGRSLWLFLVSSGGGVHDLSPRLRAEADGSFTFEFGLELPPGEDGPVPQLLVAVASRAALVSAAAAPEGAAAAEMLPRVLAEIAETGGEAAADVAGFQLVRTASAAPPPAAAEAAFAADPPDGTEAAPSGGDGLPGGLTLGTVEELPPDGDAPLPQAGTATGTGTGTATGTATAATPPAPRPQRATVAPQPPAAGGWRVRAGVSQGHINVRAGKGTMHAVLFSIDARVGGIEVLECGPPDPGGGSFDWCRIRYGGREGWVSSNGIEPE